MTAHLEAKKEEIADIVIMPGDPLRAKMIAEKFLIDYKLVNQVRNMYAYTGYYKNKRISIVSSGMGMGSMGIYAYELYKFYDVKSIIRVGTAGSYTRDLNIGDLVLVNAAYTDSNYSQVQNGTENNLLHSDKVLNFYLEKAAEINNIPITIANILTSDVFYKTNENYKELSDKYGYKCVEMETFALFQTAHMLNKKAAAVLTISDSFVTKQEASSKDRENFDKMVKIALESVVIK